MMFRTGVIAYILFLVFFTGALQADDDAHFRLTILIEMQWEDGDMYRNYFGVADLYIIPSDGRDSAYVEFVENYISIHGDEAQVPDFLGSINGLGELTIEGSGSSGDVSMTFEGTADIQVIGSVILHNNLGQVLDVTLSGTTNEIWTVHNPDGSTITMPQTAPITPVNLVLDYGHDEIEINEPWDEGTTRQVYSLAMMEDPIADPVYEYPLPD